MKTKLFLLLALWGFIHTASFAQQPDYGNPVLNKKILGYRTLEKGEVKWKNVSGKAYLDTIIPIFSQFAVGSDVAAKNATQVTAEVASKETRLSYNLAGFIKSRSLIYNLELYAGGKDNVGSIFSESKFQGNFGANVAVSKRLWSSMYLDTVDAYALHQERKRYFWVINEKLQLLQDKALKDKFNKRIDDLGSQLARPLKPLAKRKIYLTIVKLQDSLKKLALPKNLTGFYEDEIASFDKKNAKWKGFNLVTIDLKVGLGSEGYSYYQKNALTGFPEVHEQADRFTRTSFGAALNWVHVKSWISMKLSLGTGLARFKGFDAQSPKTILQVTRNDSANVSRNFEKSFSAYELSSTSLEKFNGLVSTLSFQGFFLKDKLMGAGFARQLTHPFGGVNKGSTVIDDSFSLLLSLKKKGEPFNRSVLALTLKTPDVNNRLEKSIDPITKLPYSIRKKMEVAITFGLTIDKLFYKK